MERKRQRQRSYITNKMDDSLPATISVRSLLKCITFTSVYRKFTYNYSKKLSGETLGRLSDAVYSVPLHK